MNRPLRGLWLEMLRSGSYTQAYGRLQRTADEVPPNASKFEAAIGHCCLGVLCEAVEQAGLGKMSRFESGALSGRSLAAQGLVDLEATLSQHNRERSVLAGARTTGHLVYLNDSRHMDFAQIANWIESHIPADDETEFKL